MNSTKDQLKRIATETLQRTGVQSVTLRDLGEAVGIKSSSVVYHFRNKEGLLHEVADDYSESVGRRLQEISAEEAQAGNRLLRLAEIFEELLAEDKMCLCGKLKADAHLLDESTLQVVDGFFEEIERWVAGALREGRREGMNDGEALTLARVVLSSLEGALLLDKSEGTSTHTAAVKSWIADLTGG